MANDHHGIEMGKPDDEMDSPADARAEHDADHPARPSVRKAASTRNWNRISARRAPSALRTPISRVRSVTEIDMIAITPIPPTISAIDEITIEREERALAVLIPQLQERVLRDQIEVVRLIQLQAVAHARNLPPTPVAPI